QQSHGGRSSSERMRRRHPRKGREEMNRDDIIRMAQEAGLPYIYQTGEVANLGLVERFAALVAAAEREACAQAARTAMLGAEWPLTERVMRAIRARGEK
ncbi:MAG: hypothetical protein KGR68_15185, partial [Betaproteobacteria bacterium]|nr:hypothetical protein [Betaproteobacteria bacterium]